MKGIRVLTNIVIPYSIQNDLEARPKKVEEPEEPVVRPSTSTSDRPLLSASQVSKESSLPASSIPPGQRTPTVPATSVSWAKTKKKSSEQYEKDRVGKYAPYFKGTEIITIPDLVAETLSFIITDLKNKSWRE